MLIPRAQSCPGIMGTTNYQSNRYGGLCRPEEAFETYHTIETVSKPMDQNLEVGPLTLPDPEIPETSIQTSDSLNLSVTSFQCNPSLISGCKDYLILYPLILFCIWALLYILWDDRALPGGPLFALLVLEIVAVVLGQLSEKLGMPPFFGMLVAGLLLRNVPSINVGKDLPLSISSPLRGISVAILLTQGALGVNQEKIREFGKIIPGLVVGSCFAEAISGTLAAYFIIGFPLEWALLMGFIISGMSGGGVLPYLLKIESRMNCKTSLLSIPSSRVSRDFIEIAKTACGLDAILAICLAKFCLGYIFCGGNTTCGFIKGPFEVLLGGTFGALCGGLSGVLLNNNHGNDVRSFAIFSGGVMSLVGSIKLGYPRGGPLGVFLCALISSSIWRRRNVDGINNDQLNLTFKKLWFVFQPLLFGIMGARTDFKTVDWAIVGKGLICLGLSLSTRLLASFTLTNGSKLPINERLFIALAWTPKGTLQAALGPVALDTAMELQLGGTCLTLGQQVMNVSAAVIFVSSILCPFFLKILGPQLIFRKRKIGVQIPYSCTEVMLPTEITITD